MNLNREQAYMVSKYLSDLSKIIFATTVLGFLVPTEAIKVTATIFIGGAIATLSTLLLGLKLIKENDNKS